jgi:hypothetical protein
MLIRFTVSNYLSFNEEAAVIPTIWLKGVNAMILVFSGQVWYMEPMHRENRT